MSLNYWATRKEVEKLKAYADSLNRIKNQIISIKYEVNTNWTAEEVKYILRGFDSVTNELSEVNTLINTLRNDILKAADEVKNEEENENNK